MKEKLIGKTKEEAIDLLEKNNSKFRIKSEDNERFILTTDYLINRFNLTINKGIVTDVTIG